MGKHALLSPSGANKWVSCAAAPAAERDASPDSINIYSAEGTAAHFLASECLDQGGFALGDCKGLFIYVGNQVDGGEATWGPTEKGYSYKFPVTSDMVEHVDKYLASLKEFVGEDGLLLVEQRLNIEPITGEVNAGGTADAIVIRGSELQLHDLKYGMKDVGSYENKQLIIYAAAALEEYGFMYDIDTITLVIHQPRKFDNPSVHTMTLAEFELLLEPIKVAAALSLKVLDEENWIPFATAGSHCSDSYCKARHDCPVLEGAVMEAHAGIEAVAVEADLINREDEEEVNSFLDRLGEYASKVPMVESWCKDIMSRVADEVLKNGNKVPGFKAVMGKKGNRSWQSDEAFAEALKGMRLKRELVYVEKPVSPAVLDTLKKDGVVTEGHWKRFQEVVTWAEPKVTLAPASDRRPEVEVTKEDLSAGFDSVD